MYERVGSYAGGVPLEELADQLSPLDVAWAPTHGTIIEQLPESFRACLADVIPGEWVYVMAVLIKPRGEGGGIPLHSDPPRRDDLLRHHLVLQTNDRCWNYHDGGWQQLELGGIYTMDPAKEHASNNFGDTTRIHLVVDVAEGE